MWLYGIVSNVFMDAGLRGIGLVHVQVAVKVHQLNSEWTEVKEAELHEARQGVHHPQGRGASQG